MVKKLLAVLVGLVLLSSNAMAAVPNKVLKSHESSVFISIKLRKIIDGEPKTGFGGCSGAYISNNVILTAAHCVNVPEDIKIVEIWIQQPNGKTARATVARVDSTKDLALLKTSLEGKPLKLADSRALGQDVYVTGSPLGIRFVLSHGIINKVNFEFSKDNHVKHFMLDAMVLPGNSGGAILNDRGEIIGVLVRSTSMFGAFGGVGFGFGVELEELRTFLMML